MKNLLKKSKAIFIGFFISLFLLVLSMEQIHHYNFGHYFSYGSHIDVISRYGYIGIPGQTQMYSGEFTNYSVLLVKLVACDFTSDILTDETTFPYGLQRWNSSSNSWETIFSIEPENYCQPMPTVGGGPHIVTKWILPFQSIQVITPEATGARVPFKQDDTARFIVFKDVSNANAWENAVVSEPFIIEDDVIRDENSPSMRVTH